MQLLMQELLLVITSEGITWMESNFAKANYYSVIAVKSYDKAIVKNEAIYILFQHNGMPKLSVENINSANAKVVQRVLQSLKMMFE